MMDLLCRSLGLLLIATGLLGNEWVIRTLSRGTIHLAEAEKRIFLVVVEGVLIALGWLLYRFRRAALQNLLLVLASLWIALGGLEIGLWLLPSNLDRDTPLWIPFAQKMVNVRINDGHRRRSLDNRMTPENHHPSIRQRFAQVTGRFARAGIEYLGLYPEIYDRFHHLPNRALWANPADGHPGGMVTEVYARSVYRYLLERDFLRSSPGKKGVNHG